MPSGSYTRASSGSGVYTHTGAPPLRDDARRAAVPTSATGVPSTTSAPPVAAPSAAAGLVAKATAERRAALPVEKLRERREWRDRRLMQLVAHLKAHRAG